MRYNQLDMIYHSLTPQQQEFLDTKVKRSRKTLWLNALARHKGAYLTPEELENIESTTSKYLDWQLVEMIDHGERTKKAKCRCGASLRYEYVLLNTQSAEMVSFGQTCLSNHLNIPQNVVREVVEGIRMIDLERDEILERVRDGWVRNWDLSKIKIPQTIREQLDVGLPLLWVQERKIVELLDEIERERRRVERKNEVKKSFQRIYTARPAAPTNVWNEPLPKPSQLHEQSIDELIGLMITGVIASAAIERLLSALLYVKIRPEGYRVGLLEEAADGARAGLEHELSERVRRWMLEIVKLEEGA